MFDGFEKQTDEQERKRLFASTGASALLCVVVGIALVLFASRPKPKKVEKPIEVSFRKPVVAETPKPKPKPKVVPPKAPTAKKKRSRKRSKKRVAKAAPSVPTEIPTGELAEGDAADFVAEDEIPDSIGDGELMAKAPPAPEPEPIVETPKGPDGPIVMPERAVAPKARRTNRVPVYPEKARKGGLEGTVILKVVITESGSVERIRVMKGQEPFTSAALDVVRTWRYAPAEVDGEKTAVYRIIKVPFRLRRS